MQLRSSRGSRIHSAGLGDAEAATGDWQGAASAYADAARYAPRWGKLHLRWAAALWNSGSHGEALAKLDAASRMDLNQADRALLGRIFERSRRIEPRRRGL